MAKKEVDFPSTHKIMKAQSMTNKKKNKHQFEVEFVQEGDPPSLKPLQAKKRVIPTLDNRRGPYGNEDFGMPSAIEEPHRCRHCDRLEAIKTKVYGNTLTAHQYHTVLDLMQEFSYQTEYRPLTSLDTRLQCIEESLEGVK